MAHLWVCNSEGWGVLPLSGDPVVLTASSSSPVAGANWEGAALATLHPTGGPTDPWTLLVESDSVRINGTSPCFAIRVLSDLDEISLADGRRLYFSTELLARVTAFDGAVPAPSCPRCTRPILPGDLAVQCPVCGVLYHQDEEQGRQCYTYGPCICGHEGVIGVGYRWTPEGL